MGKRSRNKSFSLGIHKSQISIRLTRDHSKTQLFPMKSFLRRISFCQSQEQNHPNKKITMVLMIIEEVQRKPPKISHQETISTFLNSNTTSLQNLRNLLTLRPLSTKILVSWQNRPFQRSLLKKLKVRKTISIGSQASLSRGLMRHLMMASLESVLTVSFCQETPRPRN